jgi:hypothetical protein
MCCVNRGFPTRRKAASHSFYRSENQVEIIGCAIAVNQRAKPMTQHHRQNFEQLVPSF